jgi:hypothetical protein
MATGFSIVFSYRISVRSLKPRPPFSDRKLTVRKLLTAALTSASLLLVAPAISLAAPCDGVGSEKPFLDWQDHASYVLVSGGDFESAAAGWTLDAGAAVAPGGNTLRPASSANSLSLPAGASATSPPICVGKGDPVARIFTRSVATGEHGQAGLRIDVLYLTSSGDVRKVKKAGFLRGGEEWAPSRRFGLAQGQFGQAAKPHGAHHGSHNRTGSIELRFTAPAASDFQIDDVFVDPRARH